MVDTRGALEGIRVLDYSHVFQGPVGTQLLADFGADVIKIERPGEGDWSRSWGPFIDGSSAPFLSLNRNKRSIALNLKAKEGIRLGLELAKTADVLVHNFRPGVMERLGLGYEDVSIVNPRLIYARSTGWGDEGPYAERGRPGHDLLARAATGWFHSLAPGELPVPGGMSADYPAGLMLTIGILIALAARERTGKGQLVSTDLFSVAFHANVWGSAQVLNKDRIEDTGGIDASEKAINSSFRTKDGFIELSPVFSHNVLRDISLAMGLGDLARDERFNSTEKRRANREELNAVLAKRFLDKTTDDWIACLEPQGILCGRINTFEESVSDPQVQANKLIIEMDHPRLGAMRLPGTPLRLHGTPSTHRTAPPDLGEHTDRILAQLGYSAAEIARLRKDGVIA